MVKIRLTRVGAKKRPFYRMIAIDVRRKRDGRALEFLGTYDPNPTPAKLDLKLDRVDAWVAQGAKLSQTADSLVKQCRRSAGAARGGGQ